MGKLRNISDDDWLIHLHNQCSSFACSLPLALHFNLRVLLVRCEETHSHFVCGLLPCLWSCFRQKSNGSDYRIRKLPCWCDSTPNGLDGWSTQPPINDIYRIIYNQRSLIVLINWQLLYVQTNSQGFSNNNPHTEPYRLVVSLSLSWWMEVGGGGFVSIKQWNRIWGLWVAPSAVVTDWLLLFYDKSNSEQ